MFENLENSHMPFIYQYNNVDVGMCCLKVNNVWKIFHTFNGTLERLDTGLSDNETECSSNFFITDNNEIVFSFISGNSDDNPKYYLYRKYGLTGRVERVTETQIGYCLKDMVVKSVNDRKTINIKSDTYEETISFEGVRQIYRVIYNSVFPAQIYLSVQKENNDTESWIYNMFNRQLKRITIGNNEMPYKFYLYNNVCYYALHTGDSWEDRRLEQTSNYQIEMIDNSIVKQTKQIKTGMNLIHQLPEDLI